MSKEHSKEWHLKYRHGFIVGTVASLVIKTILRYLLMAGYLICCDRFGLYDYGFIAKVVVTITAICLSRIVIREIGKIFRDDLDEPPFQSVGIVSCIRGISMLFEKW